jgi:hypothetical protein
MKRKLFVTAGAALVATLIAGCVPGGQGINITSVTRHTPDWMPRYEGQVNYLSPTTLSVAAPIEMSCSLKSFTINPAGNISDVFTVKSEYSSIQKGEKIAIDFILEFLSEEWELDRKWKLTAEASRGGKIYDTSVARVILPFLMESACRITRLVSVSLQA